MEYYSAIKRMKMLIIAMERSPKSTKLQKIMYGILPYMENEDKGEIHTYIYSHF